MSSAKTEIGGRTVIYQSQLFIQQNKEAHVQIFLGKCALPVVLTEEFVAFTLNFSTDTENRKKRVESGPNESKEGEGTIRFINIGAATEPGILDEMLVARLGESGDTGSAGNPRALEVYLTATYQAVADYHLLSLQFTAELKS